MEDDPRIEFGRALRAARKERGLSQEDLALEAGLDRTYISGIEIGRRNVSLVNIHRLARALGVHPARLFGVEENAECQPPMSESPAEGNCPEIGA